MTSNDVILATVSASVGGLVGAIGGAFGATASLKTFVTRLDKRHDRVEQRVGITQDGGLTGNGLIGDVADMWEEQSKLDRRVIRLEAASPNLGVSHDG